MQATGAAAWGCGLILAGGALFLFSEPNRWLTRALYAGAFAISALPFSVTAYGWVSGGTGFWPAFPFLLLSHAMLIAGYIRHAQRTAIRTSNADQPIWAKNVFPAGILLLLAMSLLLGLYGWEGALRFGNWIAGPTASLLAVGLLCLLFTVWVWRWLLVSERTIAQTRFDLSSELLVDDDEAVDALHQLELESCVDLAVERNEVLATRLAAEAVVRPDEHVGAATGAGLVLEVLVEIAEGLLDG